MNTPHNTLKRSDYVITTVKNKVVRSYGMKYSLYSKDPETMNTFVQMFFTCSDTGKCILMDGNPKSRSHTTPHNLIWGGHGSHQSTSRLKLPGIGTLDRIFIGGKLVEQLNSKQEVVDFLEETFIEYKLLQENEY